MTYQNLNGTAFGTDLTYLFAYTNSITHGMATIFICIAFFFIVLISSILTQIRITGGNVRPESSFLIACFVTLILELIFMQKTLIPGWFFVLTMFGTLISFLWLSLAQSETP